jgi:hypothetical protein
MSLHDHYDWVVLGDHPGAYLSGVMVAQLGLSVLFVRLAPGMKSRFSMDGQYLDPESNHLIGLGKVGEIPGLTYECLHRSGMTAQETQWIEPGGSLPEILTPDLRVKLKTQDTDFSWELKRELGPESQGLVEALSSGQKELLSYWLRLPQRLTIDAVQSQGPAQKTKRLIRTAGAGSLSSVMGSLGKVAEMREPRRKQWLGRASLDRLERRAGEHYGEMLRGLWEGITQLEPQDPVLWEILHFLAVGRSSASFRGGMTAYRDYLLKLAMRLGAENAGDETCRRVFVENGHVNAIQVGSSGNRIATGGAVLGCSVSDLAEVLTVNGQGWFKKLKGRPKATGWRFTVGATVSKDAIAPGVGKRMLWQEPGAPSLEIEIVSPDDMADPDLLPDSRVILARTVLPLDRKTLSASYQRIVAARMFRQLSAIFPFLEFHVEKIYPDFRADVGTGEGAKDLGELYDFPMPELVPENLRVYAGEGLGSKSGIDGIFLASGEAYPKYGSLGPTIAALESAAWIAHRCGLPGPLPSVERTS